MPRPSRRQSLGALLGAAAGALVASPSPAPAATPRADDAVQHCWTDALPREQIAAGATSRVTCALVDRATRARLLRADPVLAIHWDGANGTASSLAVRGAACSGYGISFTSSDWWNNRVSSTEFVSCGNVKHYVGPGYTGDTQLVSGGYGQVANLNGTLNNQASSIDYG